MCNVTRVRTAAEHVDIVKDGGPYFQATFFLEVGVRGLFARPHCGLRLPALS